MKNILFIIILPLIFMGKVCAENVTIKYGGDWVDTTVIQNENFMSMTGSFAGTNVMKMEDKEIITNFKCTDIHQTDPAAILMGSCNMKQ